MRNFWIDLFALGYIFFKIFAFGSGVRRLIPYFSVFQSVILGLGFLYVPFLLISLFQIPVFVPYAVCINLIVLYGLPNLVKIKASNWLRSLVPFLGAVFVVWGLQAFYCLPSGDDASVHSYILDQIIRFGFLLTSHNPVPYQDVFGPHKYIFYPSGLHAPLAALSLELKFISSAYQAMSLQAAAALGIGLTLASTLPVSDLLIKRDKRLSWLAYLGGLIVMCRIAFPIGPLREGAVNRVISMSIAFGLIFQQLIQESTPNKRSLFLNASILPWMFLLHPSGGLLIGFLSAYQLPPFFKNKDWKFILKIGGLLLFGAVLVVAATRSGGEHTAAIREMFYPDSSNHALRASLQNFYGWLKFVFWWQGDGMLELPVAITRVVLFVIGVFCLSFCWSEAKKFIGFCILIFCFALLFLYAVQSRQLWSFPLTVIFYNGFGLYTGRLAEIGYPIYSFFALMGVYFSVSFAFRRGSRPFGVLLFVSLVGFVVRPMLRNFVPGMKSAASDFRPANREFMEKAVKGLHPNEDQVILLAENGIRSAVQLRGIFVKPLVTVFPECLPEIQIDSESCRAKLAYLKEILTCATRMGPVSFYPCCAIAKEPWRNDQNIVLFWSNNAFYSLNYFHCK